MTTTSTTGISCGPENPAGFGMAAVATGMTMTMMMMIGGIYYYSSESLFPSYPQQRRRGRRNGRPRPSASNPWTRTTSNNHSGSDDDTDNEDEDAHVRGCHTTTTAATTGAYEQLIGKTPLIRLEHVSQLIQRSIYAKMESMNPGGTGKDRAAWNMIRVAEQQKQLPPPTTTAAAARIHNNMIDQYKENETETTTTTTTTTKWNDDNPTEESSSSNNNNNDNNSCYDDLIQAAGKRSKTGGIVVEGTSGSTGISLALLAASRGHGCIVVLPDDQALEKQQILTSLGAQVHIVPPSSISNPHHYVNIARRIAERCRRRRVSAPKRRTTDHDSYQAVFMNQFENQANFEVHYHETGPEIYQACPQLNAFVMSAGTGGTIAGVGKYLKEQQKQRQRQSKTSKTKTVTTTVDIQIVLVDPPGSSLYHRIEHGVVYAPQQAEQKLKRHRYDTIAEGIGLDRMTHNFALGESSIDKAIRVSDQDAVDMAHWIYATEGLFVGSSSSMNLVGAIETALSLPPQSHVVTVICDTGQRHVTRFWNREFCLSRGLQWPGDDATTTVPRIPNCLKGCFIGGDST